MAIQLDHETQQILEERVAAGKYASIADAAREAVRLLVEQEQREEHLTGCGQKCRRG